MSWSIISADAVQPQPWRNKGGWTRELLAWPHANDWALRISVADIEADGPFSKFEGVDRWFAVLQGGGVRLWDYELLKGDDLLHGALAPDCELIAGQTRDFNLMHRRGSGRMQVDAASLPLQPQGRWVGLFSAEGGVLRHGGRSMALAPMSLAWCEQPTPQPCEFEGRGAAWWMQWSENG